MTEKRQTQWVHRDDRMPTEADADERGRVLVFWWHRVASIVHLDAVATYENAIVYWAPLTSPPKEER
jgi:hypothetical protein